MQTLDSRKFGSIEIEVDCVSVSSLFKKYGVPYYMKIDIEDYEEVPVEGMLNCHINPVYVSFEASSFGPACRLYYYGYRQFNIVSQRTVPEHGLPSPDLEGKYIDFKFKLGSSGAFGKELPGVWGTIDDCVREQVIWLNMKRNIPRQKNDWADIHAFDPGQIKHFRSSLISDTNSTDLDLLEV